jgi:ferredoxin-type protein NapG
MIRIRFLRPPGAKPEREFLARCLQCGQCAQICPFDCITLRTGFNFFVSGTPQIYPREAPCKLCMRCTAICPSDALDDVNVREVRMGRARLERNLCHTWRGQIICRSCFEGCPLKGTAIILEKGIYPVITDRCVGCGICEHVCPREAIVTVPIRFHK